MEMYSGSKDGIVHVWNLVDAPNMDSDNFGNRLDNMQLTPIASLQGQGSAVNAITALDSSFGKMIVYGSHDKSLRVCKAVPSETQNYQDFLNTSDMNDNFFDDFQNQQQTFLKKSESVSH